MGEEVQGDRDGRIEKISRVEINARPTDGIATELIPTLTGL